MSARLFVLALLSGLPTIAHAAPAPSDAPHQQPSRSGFAFGDTLQVGAMGHHVGVWNEMHLGFQVLPRLTLGTGINMFMGRRQYVRSPGGDPRRLDALYGGLRGAFAIIHRRRLDFGIDGYFGGGQVCFVTLPDSDGNSDCREHTAMFVVEPRIYMNYKVGYYARLGLAAGYRFVTRHKLGLGDNLVLSGAFLATTVEFGMWK